MDRLYINIKTGEKKHLPQKVYEANAKKWKPAPESEVKPTEQKSAPLEIKTSDSVNFTESKTSEAQEAPEPTKESLQAEYEALSGQKPDGRWSPKKLQEKIQETKGSK